MNLYIFNEIRPAAIYGVGTYVRELTEALRHSKINVCVVNLKSAKLQIQMEIIDGIRQWYFPEPIKEQWSISHKKQIELYHRNVVYLLQLDIEDKKNLIFHLNYMDSKPLADAIKNAFDCKTVLVVHYLESLMTLSGNISQLRRIIAQPDEQVNNEERIAKMFYLKEKDFLQSHTVDKIICLSNHTYDLLHQDYQIEKEKMVVIYNGLKCF